MASYVTRAPGGHGAVREIVETLLKARGVWEEMLERYFTRAGSPWRVIAPRWSSWAAASFASRRGASAPWRTG